MRGKREYTVDAMLRSLIVLDKLAEADRDLGVLEVSQATKVHVSTAYRLLSTLMSRGFVEKNPETDKYRLGIKVFELGMARKRRMDFRAVAVSFLRNLHNELGETVFMGILRGQEILIIEEFFQFKGIVFRSQTGCTEPLYCSGIGKALLAYLRPEQQEEIVQSINLERFTDNTLTRRRDLRAELMQIRERGYSIDNEEIELGVKCVAAPILDHEGCAVAAFSVAGPKHRIEQRLHSIIARVLEVGAAINTRLGYV